MADPAGDAAVGASAAGLDADRGKVRTLYADLSAWAHKDPARWARWVAPCPVPARAVSAAGRRNRDRQIAETQQRTRSLAPVVPSVVASITQALHREERQLARGDDCRAGAGVRG